jgi:hypothetical protein
MAGLETTYFAIYLLYGYASSFSKGWKNPKSLAQIRLQDSGQAWLSKHTYKDITFETLQRIQCVHQCRARRDKI